MATLVNVGVRDLKNRLSHYLRRVAHGDRVTVTDRGRPVVVIVPPDEHAEVAGAWAMVREGVALRAYDAIHLASALEAGLRLGLLPRFACWDRTLNAAAAREGLELLRVKP